MKYFGTDGFRGEANVFLTVEHAYKIGRYLGWYYCKDHKAKVVIGKDTRKSSYMFEYALVSGLTASGADVYLLHVTTTPSVAYITRTEDFDCGIMISASHNPYYDNGIKIIDSNGHKISSDVEGKIEAYIDNDISELPLAVKHDIGIATDYSIGRNRYVGYLISTVTRSFKNIRIGLDCANGSASAIAKSVFDALGAKTYVVGDQPDGSNINKGCGSTHIENLRHIVMEKKLDIGFAFDGDADRCIAVDELGNEFNGDQILYVCGKYLKESRRLNGNTIVATIMSNLGLFKALEKANINYVKTTVGDKYVNEEMVRNGYSLGGEQSGHIIFSKHATTGDGILTSLMVMEALLEQKTTLSKLSNEIVMYPQKIKNIIVDNKKAVTNNEMVLKVVDEIKNELSSEGRILIRESGTEPVIRIMVEAETNPICDSYIERVYNVIKQQKLSQ